MDRYCLQAISHLALQLKRGPKRLALRELLNVEFLLTVVEPDKAYPFEFVCHALTNYRPASDGVPGSRLLDGEALVSDLVSLAEEISEEVSLRLDGWLGPVYSVSELAERFDVSTKTIFRWRRRGLVGWRFRFPDQRTRLLFPERSVRRFVARHTELVTRGSNFSQLTKAERQRIVVRASELVKQEPRTVNAVARLIATESGRAVETIRLILKHHDEAHPGAGIFNRSPLQVEVNDQRLAVWEAYVDGATVEALAQRFDKPVAWVYKTITQMRARDMRARKIEFVGSPEFEAPDAEQRILHPVLSGPLQQALGAVPRRVPADLPPYLAQLFRIPLLTREGEQVLFRKLNYLKYKAQRRIEAIDPETARAADLDRVDALLDEAARVKNEIVQANLRLVVSIAKRHVYRGQDLFELVSDGNVSLMRAVDKFDYTRGYKFSTYASWALMKNFARSIPEQRRHVERYQTGWDSLFDSVGLHQPEETESDQLASLRGTVHRMLASLDTRERSIIQQRYGLDDGGEPQTLEQIGRRFGVSKERVRQLEARALMKLRGGFVADAERLFGT
jgi:RNA polymerase primary sigma factor